MGFPKEGDSWLKRSFVFYGSYHNDPTNQLIHIVFVWTILWTAFTMLAFTPSLLPGLNLQLGFLPTGTSFLPNWNLVACAVYFFWYLVVEPEGYAGYLCCMFVLLGYVASTLLFHTFGADAFTWALRVHIVSWLAQFVGHGIFEGRSPALLHNLFQAFAMAPLFVVMEVLFKFGYRPDFQAACQIDIDKQLKQWATEKKKAKGK